ncbi:MAG: DUF4363 family protein [Clostridia bacterium]|nr:DUF4363 family protein [Clostridia bacterium]
MKFFIWAIVTIAIIAVLCGWGTMASTEKIDSMLSTLEEANSYSGSIPENAKEVVEKLSKKWEDDVFLISMLLPHHHLDEVKEKLVALKAYANTDEFAEWRDATLVFKEELLHIRDLLGISADNIL